MAEYFFTEKAREDLHHIFEYLAQRNVAGLHRLIDNMEKTCERLALFPEMAPIRADLFPEIRGFPFERYILYYKIEGNCVAIVRVLDQRQDSTSIFSK